MTTTHSKLFDLTGKVAVITGAASGFGRALAIRCAREGMPLALADVDEKGLQATLALLEPYGVQSLIQKCDVSRAEELDHLADQVWVRFGAAHLLFNNAGVGVVGPIWAATLEDWNWTLGINLMGVVHGIRSFVPRMIAQGDTCHIVNTASAAGLTSVPGSSVYCVSKHGVVTLSECLHHDLKIAKAAIGVSVLCPAFVDTGIADSHRNRPASLAATNPLAEPYAEIVRQATKAGRLSADDVAWITLDAVKSGRFYVLPHSGIKKAVELRMREIIDERQPSSPMAQAL